MHRRLNKLALTNDEMLETLDVISKSIVTTTIPALNELMKTTVGKTEIVNNVAFAKLNIKDDAALFKRILSITEKYNKIISSLKSAISDNLPDTITAGSSNINNRLAISLLSEGVYFAKDVPMMLSNLIERYYSKTGTELDPAITSKLTQKLVLLIQILPEFEKADLAKVVDSIGNIPTITTLKHEATSDIPVEVVMGFFKNNFNIKDFYTQTFLKRTLGYFNFKKEHKKNSNITKNFIGNPIYHLRLFLVDLNSMRLESLKEEKGLLELRLLELNESNADGKLKRQISYYENKLNKLDMKIKHLSEIE